MYGYAFEVPGPVSFEAKLFFQTGIHTFNGAPLVVSLAFACGTVSPEVLVHPQQRLLIFALVCRVRNHGLHVVR